MRQELPSFSIIIPTYRRPAQLAACLEAVARLDYPRERFEVIVVDDGSLTPPHDVVASFRSRLDAKLLTQAHAGPAAARNTGAASAVGDFFAFTDDDCLPDENWLRAFAAHFMSTPEGLLGGRTLNALEDNPYAATSQSIIEVVYEHFNRAGGALFFASNNFAVPAAVFRRLGGFDEEFFTSEDREFCDRWTHAGFPMAYVPDALIRHAHPLRLRTLWQQHFSYGRGAFRFHRARRSRLSRSDARIKPDLRFYFKLLSHSFLREKGYRALALTLLVFWTQLASAAGFTREMFARRPVSNEAGAARPDAFTKFLTTNRGIFLSTLILLCLLLSLSLYRAYPYIDDVSEASAAGNDWLRYKRNALSILRSGLTMPAVEGNYHLPGGFLYNYFVAAVFALFGENSTCVYMVQAAMLACSVGLATLAFKPFLTPTTTPLYFLMLSFVALFDVFLFYTFRLLSENLALLLLPLFYLLILRTFERRSVLLAALAGAALGLCVLSRQNLIMIGPSTAALLFIYLKGRRSRTLISSIFLACFCLACSLLPLRNYAATGEMSMPLIRHAAQDFASNLEIKETLTPATIGEKALTAFAFHARRILFCAGLTTAMGLPFYWLKPHWTLMWMGAFVYAWRLLRRGRMEFGEVFAVVFILSYLVPVLAVADVHNYGVRMILPVMPVVLVLGVGALTTQRPSGKRSEAI